MKTKQFHTEGVYVLEQQQAFAQSLLWDWQRAYFATMGVEAWRQGDVPHYVTSNPTIAHSYAEIVFAFWKDRQRLNPSTAPLFLCELGSGSGRFAFYFLKQLQQLCEREGIASSAFRYVLTDFAPRNLEFWQQHPNFQPYFANGLLDMALFDVSHSETLVLQVSGETLGVGDLEQPLIVIANYLFDSIPQELFYVHEGHCYPGVVSLTMKEDPTTLDEVALLARVTCEVGHLPQAVNPNLDEELQALVGEYQAALTDTYLLFPAEGLDCVRRLKQLSPNGLLLLSADKGEIELAGLAGRQPPLPVQHGSFSLSVNYHAFRRFCERVGGLALQPATPHGSVSVNVLLILGAAEYHEATQLAYQRWVRDFGPDDFFSIINNLHETIPTLSFETLLAYLRLSRYDSHQLTRYLPRLLELAPQLTLRQRQALKMAVDEAWAVYFPLGEAYNLAEGIATLLYALDEYAHAMFYFKHSLAIYGLNSATLFNIAACQHMLGAHEEGNALLRMVLQHDPNNIPAQELLASSSNRK